MHGKINDREINCRRGHERRAGGRVVFHRRLDERERCIAGIYHHFLYYAGLILQPDLEGLARLRVETCRWVTEFLLGFTPFNSA